MGRSSFLALALLSAGAVSLFSQQAPSAVPSIPPLVASQTPSPSVPAHGLRSAFPTKEDWSVLPLEGSGLDISKIDAVPLAQWDMGDSTEELLRVQWRAGDPLDLYVVRPKGVEKPPAILYLYDYRNLPDRYRDDGWCKRATKGGFAAVGFLSAVSGDRIHTPRPLKQWFVSELQESLASSAHDVQMVLDYLDKRGDIDMSRIGMFGVGSGASIAVLAAAADPRIKTLDLLDPWGDWPDWLKESPLVPEEERASYLKPEFLGKVAKLDPSLYLPQLASRNIRIEYQLDDPTTPKSAREAILATAPKSVDLIRYKDTAEHARAYHATGMAGWIKGQLHPGPSPAPAPTTSSLPSAGLASNNP